MDVKLSARMIKDDLDIIISSLKDEDVEIPTLWDACKPSFPAIAFILSLQAIVIFFDGGFLKLDFSFAMSFSFFLCFFVFIGVTSASAQYQSLPEKIRRTSLIFRMIRSKIRIYAILWCLLSMISALVIIINDFPPDIMSGISMVCMVFLSFIFNADMSRYNLSALSAAIATWREQSPKV